MLFRTPAPPRSHRVLARPAAGQRAEDAARAECSGAFEVSLTAIIERSEWRRYPESITPASRLTLHRRRRTPQRVFRMSQTPLPGRRFFLVPSSGASPVPDDAPPRAHLRPEAPRVREGFKDWIEAGFPRDPRTGKPEAKYFQRSNDRWVRPSWEQAFDYATRALDDISRASSRGAIDVVPARAAYERTGVRPRCVALKPSTTPRRRRRASCWRPAPGVSQRTGRGLLDGSSAAPRRLRRTAWAQGVTRRRRPSSRDT